MNTLQKAIELNLIAFDDEGKYITYVRQNKKRNFQNPEEKVQAETFCKLVLEYGYSANRIGMFLPIKMGVTTKEADIVRMMNAQNPISSPNVRAPIYLYFQPYAAVFWA